MTLYSFHDLTLEVQQEGQETGADLDNVIQNLSWVRADTPVRQPSLRLSVRLNDHGVKIPRMSREVFRADGFCGLEKGDDFYLSDGSSLFHLQASRGQGEAQLAPSFFDKPSFLQRNFWAFGLLKLLRPIGIYCLHAAGVVSRKELGLLIIGESGGGKSTLAIGLIQQGWGYLSDDAVLLRLQPEGVEALAFRKHFYIDASTAKDYANLPLGEEVSDTAGRRKRRVRLDEAYPEQYVSECLPRLLLFSQIVPHTQSALLPLDRLSALKNLLAQSGPQLFDTGTMAQHLEVLKRLVQQTVPYELRAGRDLYRHPVTLGRLLAKAEGEREWPGLL